MKRNRLIIASVLLVLSCTICAFGVVGVVADSENYETSPNSIFVNTTLNIYGNGDGTVSAVFAYTHSLLGEDIDRVTVYLYRHEGAYVEDVENMELVGYTTSRNVELYSTVIASASTNGSMCYWYAEAHYYVDDNAEVIVKAVSASTDAAGNII